MELPIDIVMVNKVRLFRWKQTTDTYGGKRVVQYEGPLHPSLEGPVAELITLAKQQAKEIESLKRINQGLADRVVKQSELLSKKAEAPQVTAVIKGKKV